MPSDETGGRGDWQRRCCGKLREQFLTADAFIRYCFELRARFAPAAEKAIINSRTVRDFERARRWPVS